MDVSSFPDQPAPGRDCGTCTLCCKVYDVPVLEKPMGQWCQHCAPGRGCKVHETRPDFCRTFHCLWILAPYLEPNWKPERARFVLTINPVTGFLMCQLDPSQPTSWRKEPYYSQFKRWAAAGLETGRLVIVYLNNSATLVLPDKDVPLGVPKPGETILLERTPRYGGGYEFNARFGLAAD